MLYSTQIRWINLKEIKLFNTLKFWTVCMAVLGLLTKHHCLFSPFWQCCLAGTLTCLINEHTIINEQTRRIFSFITWKIMCRVGKFVIYYMKNCCRVDFFFRNAKRACSFIRQVRVLQWIKTSLDMTDKTSPEFSWNLTFLMDAWMLRK